VTEVEHRMTGLSRTLVWSTAIGLSLCATAARAAPLDDCSRARGTAALAPCSQVVDDEKEKPATRAAARLLRARAELDLSDLERAEADIEAARAVTPNNPFAYRLRARLRSLQGKETEARADFDRAVGLPQTPASKYVSFLERGNFLIRNMELRQALADFNEAVRLDPTKAAAYVGRAVANKTSGDIPNALADLDRAKAVEPGYKQTFLERGDILIAEKRYAEAIADFEAALAIDAKDARALRGRTAANALAKTAGTPASPAPSVPPPAAAPPASPPPAPSTAAPATPPGPPAPSTATPTLPPGPGAPSTTTPATPPSDAAKQTGDARRAKLAEALTLRRGGKHKEALAIYEELARAAPADIEVTVERGRTLVLLERWKDALDTLKPVIDNKSAPPAMKAFAFEARGEVLARNNQYEAAVLSATAALEINPKLLGALFWRGVSAVSLGTFETAIADFRQAGTIVPTSPLYPGWEALAHLGEGDLPKARDAIDRSNAIQADNTLALTARARLRLVAGDVDGAEADLATLAKRGPLGPVSLQTQQLVMVHKIFKPTDQPATKRKP
jgi:tetratricopeptide (TPR) repeat protein